MTDDDMTSDAQTAESAEAIHGPPGGVEKAGQTPSEPGAQEADRAPLAEGVAPTASAATETPSPDEPAGRTYAQDGSSGAVPSEDQFTERGARAGADGLPRPVAPLIDSAAEDTAAPGSDSAPAVGDSTTSADAAPAVRSAAPAAESSASVEQPVQEAARARNRLRLSAAALAAACLGLLILVGYLGYALYVHNRIEERRAAVLNAARQEAVNFVTIDYNNLDRDFANVLGLATGEFEQQFAANRDQLQDLLRKNQTVSTGEVRDAAIVTVNDNSARVIAIVDSTVSNTAAPNGSPRFYRLQMNLDKVNGRWLVSQLEFVGG